MASKKSSKKKISKPVKKAKAKKPKAKKKRPRNKKDPKDHYVNAKEFFEEIKTYYKTDVISDHLAQSTYKIAVGLS